MVKDAEANAEADKEKLEAIEARNNADSIVTSTEKSLKEHGSKLGKDDKTNIEKALEELKSSLKDEKADTKSLKDKTDALVQSSMKLGEILYKEAQEKAEKEKQDTSEKPKNSKSKAKNKDKDAKVVDADFEDVTEKKKPDSKGDDKSTGPSA